MKIVIDIGHPAHVHLFKNFAHDMAQKNHELTFTFRNRGIVPELLYFEGFKCVSLGNRYKSKSGKFFWLI